MLSFKAQGSFELLLLVAFVVSLSLILATYFFQENDKTRVEALAKSIVLEKLNKENNFYFINEVEFVAPSTINICLKPKTGTPALQSSFATNVQIELRQRSGNNDLTVEPVKYTDTQAC